MASKLPQSQTESPAGHQRPSSQKLQSRRFVREYTAIFDLSQQVNKRIRGSFNELGNWGGGEKNYSERYVYFPTPYKSLDH